MAKEEQRHFVVSLRFTVTDNGNVEHCTGPDDQAMLEMMRQAFEVAKKLVASDFRTSYPLADLEIQDEGAKIL